ncbi:hypothetical protein BGM26_19660 [Bacillus sp. FJAT-29790]|uniref:hypothetical protein n=1 Tax=Bacillus sp. FJAT-29790 TaxID=1895002 RepID=UPI001C214D37|nr:hypothetical protein [Bacillus sp. FJAT-29790]MBU8881143.1 hypothetical protein [Bacillus sp. FJAT-29790]
MFYQIRLLKGIFYPKYVAYQLNQAEEPRGILPKSILLVAFSLLIFLAASVYGIGTESLSKELTTIKSNDYEWHKLLFIVGKIIWATLYPLLILFVPTTIFWTLTDLEFKKLLIMQLFVVFILLINQMAVTLFAILFGINLASSPLSLGVIAQYMTANDFLISFLGCISIFQLWAIFIQYIYIRTLSEKSIRFIVIMILSVNVFFWITSALFSYINFEKLL